MSKNVVRIKDIRKLLASRFPTPITNAEQSAFFHVQGEEMTLAESETYVKASKKNKRLMLEAITLRLRKKWNKSLSRSYREWTDWYKKYGRDQCHKK